MHRIEKELDAADQTIGDKLHVLDMDNDGIVSDQETNAAICICVGDTGDNACFEWT